MVIRFYSLIHFDMLYFCFLAHLIKFCLFKISLFMICNCVLSTILLQISYFFQLFSWNFIFSIFSIWSFEMFMDSFRQLKWLSGIASEGNRWFLLRICIWIKLENNIISTQSAKHRFKHLIEFQSYTKTCDAFFRLLHNFFYKSLKVGSYFAIWTFDSKSLAKVKKKTVD